jgi:hypothetical protein
MNAASLSRALDRVDRRKMMGSSASLDDMMEQGIVIFGSAETVRQRLAEYQRSMQFGKLVTLLQFGSLPAELTRKNMEAFAGEVMPYLRSLGAAGNGDAGTRLRRDAAQVGAS